MFNTNAEGSYSYYDAQGRYLTTKHVYHLPDGTLKFTLDNTHSNPKDSSNLKNELLFYHLRNLVNTPKGETIYIVENEKDADTFEQFKMIAVCTYNGAGSGHFPRSVVPYFAGKNVVIFHANNDVSNQFAQEEASLVNPVATSVKVIDLSEIWEIMPEQATIGDYLQSYGDAGLQQAKHLIENTPIWTTPKVSAEAKHLPIRSVKDLMQQHFAPTEFLVNGILPSGLALLASPPKFGKSWFALQLCLAVAKGTPFLGLSTTKSDVLYLDLEDGDADLQERIKKLNMGEDAPEGLLYSTEVPTIADGLVDMLHQTLCSNPSIKLVVIDTLGVVLGAQSNDSNSFTQEYALFHSLKKVAADHAIALLVIHHLRKANDENNPFNRIYGSVATQAALDTMMVLEKNTHFSDTAQLHISGRRCAQQEFVLSFDTDSCSWSMVGNADEVDEKFHHAQYERSETVIAIKEAISRGNGTWRGSMSQLSRVAESINALQLFHGSIDTACGRYFFFSPVGGNTKHPTGVKSKLLRTRGKRKMKQTVKTSRVAGQLEKMFRLLNNHFFNGELPEVVISLKKTVGAYGHFTCGKVWQAGDERRYEINISSATLNRPIEETCATLLHEMCHLACAVGYSSKVLDENGKPEPIKDTSNNGVYHNKKFKAMAEAHGLEVEHHPKYGWTITSPGIDLLDFIEQQGWQDLQMVEGISLLDVLGTLPKGSSGAGAETRTKKPSSTRKYICPKCGNSCRATKVINLICGDCMEKMVVAE